jgi:hypothetical protein
VALGSHTALELAGFTPLAREAQEIHLVVSRGAKVSAFAGVRVRESRRLRPEDVVRREGLPCTGVERSAIDAAAWQPFPRFARLMLAAVVQRRLTSAAQLEAELRTVGRVRHKAYMRLALIDIADGAQSLGELDLAPLGRRFGLVPPSSDSARRCWAAALPRRGVAAADRRDRRPRGGRQPPSRRRELAGGHETGAFGGCQPPLGAARHDFRGPSGARCDRPGSPRPRRPVPRG